MAKIEIAYPEYPIKEGFYIVRNKETKIDGFVIKSWVELMEVHMRY